MGGVSGDGIQSTFAGYLTYDRQLRRGGGVDLIKSFSEENISITNTQSFVTHLCILHDLANVRYTHSPIIHDIYDSYLLILDIYYSMYKLRF